MGYSKVLEAYEKKYGSYEGFKIVVPDNADVKTSQAGLFTEIMSVFMNYPDCLDINLTTKYLFFEFIFGKGTVAAVVNSNLVQPFDMINKEKMDFFIPIKDLRKEVNNILLDTMEDQIHENLNVKEVVEELNRIFDENILELLFENPRGEEFVNSMQDIINRMAYEIRPFIDDQVDSMCILNDEYESGVKIFNLATPKWIYFIDILHQVYAGNLGENIAKFNIVLDLRINDEGRYVTTESDASIYFTPYTIDSESYEALCVLLLNKYNLDIRGFDYSNIVDPDDLPHDIARNQVTEIIAINRNNDLINRWPNLSELVIDINNVLEGKSDFKMKLKKIGDDLFVDENGNEYDFSLE